MFNLEKEILKEQSQEFTQHMDRMLMEHARFVIRLDEGWHLVKISKLTDNHHAIDIIHWLTENVVRDDYQRDRLDFIFLRRKDAMLFALRWA